MQKKCPHSFFVNGLCGMCGISKAELPGQLEGLQRFDKFEGKADTVQSTLKDEHKSHIGRKTLQLILDLDHTLLNTTLMSDLNIEQ